MWDSRTKMNGLAHRAILAALVLVLSSGCIRMKRQPAPSAWPEPVDVRAVQRFDGVYGSRLDAGTGRTLFEFLTNRGLEPGKHGTQVEIRSSQDGAVLQVRLLDEHHVETAAAALRRGVEFDLCDGGLDLHGPFRGPNLETTNLAGYWENRQAQLFLATTGDLLGKRSDRGAGFLFYMIPFAAMSGEWLLWPRLATLPQ